MNIKGKTFLITGASQGIGRYLAVHFAAKAGRVIVAARNAVHLEATAERVRAVGGECLAVACDLRRPDTLEQLARRALEGAGGVDVLINNAADVTSKPFLDTSLEDIEGLVKTNVTGCLQLTRLVAPMMIARGGGAVVNVSSLAGYKPNPTQTVYSVSKAAVNGISEALRAELAPHGIAVINAALSSVAVEGDAAPGQVPVAEVARRLEQAIVRETPELFLSPITKWLMRLYKFYPPLMRLR